MAGAIGSQVHPYQYFVGRISIYTLFTFQVAAVLDVAEKKKKNEDEVELSPMGAVEEDLAPVVCLH